MMFEKPKPLIIADLKQERQYIRTITRLKMPAVEEFTEPALAFLEQDMADLALEAVSSENPDIFVLRANQIGVELFERKAYHYAVIVFGALLSKAEEYVKTTGKTRHLVALKVNLGVALIQAGNFDAGVNIVLEAAMEDSSGVYSTATGMSHAVRLLHGYILDEVASHIALLCTAQFRIATGYPLSRESVLTMANHANPFGAATLASLIPLMQHPEWQKRASTQYGRVRIMDGLRWSSAMLEGMVKYIGKGSLDPNTSAKFSSKPKLTLWPAYELLFQNQSWWGQVEAGKALVQHMDGDADIVRKYQTLLALPETNREEILSKTILLSHTTRNLSAHHLELPYDVIDQVGQDIIKYQLLAQLLIFDWAYREGHFILLVAPGVWPR